MTHSGSRFVALVMLPIALTLLGIPGAQATGTNHPPAAGSCWVMNEDELDSYSWRGTRPVPCTAWHSLEITGVYRVPDAVANRGRNSMATVAYAKKQCMLSVNQHMGSSRANLGFNDWWFVASSATWSANGKWVVCGGVPQMWIGSKLFYGQTRGAYRPGFFAPRCEIVGRDGDLSGEVPCSRRGARSYSQKPMSFRYLELMNYPGLRAVLRRCRSMSVGHAAACPGVSRSEWNAGNRYIEIFGGRWRGPVPRLNIQPI